MDLENVLSGFWDFAISKKEYQQIKQFANISSTVKDFRTDRWLKDKSLDFYLGMYAACMTFAAIPSRHHALDEILEQLLKTTTAMGMDLTIIITEKMDKQDAP